MVRKCLDEVSDRVKVEDDATKGLSMPRRDFKCHEGTLGIALRKRQGAHNLSAATQDAPCGRGSDGIGA